MLLIRRAAKWILSMAKGKKKATDSEAQLARFREMARELEADESLDAMDRAFARLDMKKKEPRQSAKQKPKAG